MPVKQNLKEHFEDGKLDLSMLGLTEVPVKDIAAIPKATTLDLSNNRLVTIGKNFPLSLTHLVHLDLARNQLTELPENIGLLLNLKHLDLYSNQLQSLPLSFGNLKALRWLDLKQNPLLPKLAQIAGPCLDSAQCTSAAKNMVELLSMMNKQVEVEKQRRQEQRQKSLEENERKAQELKKEQQLLKKKNKKARRDEAENAKLLEFTQNGDVNDHDGILDNIELETENGGINDQTNFNENERNVETNLQAEKKSSKQIVKPNSVLLFFRTLTKIIIISTLLIVLGLFILNLLDETYYNAARKQLNKIRDAVSSQLPKPFVTKLNRGYITSRKLFWKSVSRLGKLSISVIQNMQDWYSWLITHEAVQLYFDQIKSGWQVLWIRISEIYRTFMVNVH